MIFLLMNAFNNTEPKIMIFKKNVRLCAYAR